MRNIALIIFSCFAFTLISHSAYAACTAPVGVPGDLMYNATYDVFQGCTENGWHAFHEVGSPPPGTVMPDGSVYAGLSPDGDVPMYTTPADAPSLMTWNDGTSNYVDTAMVNCTNVSPGTAVTCRTGEANTAFLVGLSGSGSPAPYIAAEYCDGLTAHGHSDWYLPAQDELNVLFINRAAIGGFNTTGVGTAITYSSSSESAATTMRTQWFTSGGQYSFTNYKRVSLPVRCVRK